MKYAICLSFLVTGIICGPIRGQTYEQAADPNELGIKLENSGDYRAAAASFMQATRLAPGNAAAKYNLGTAYFQLKQFDEAEAAFKEAIRLDPSNFKAYNQLGVTYLETSQTKSAIRAFTKAIE